MWPQPGGQLDPPLPPPVPEVLPVRNTGQFTGPFYFGPPWASSERYNIISAAAPLPPQLQIQPSHRMSLESRAYKASRTRQRLRGPRRPSYRVSGVNEYCRRQLLTNSTEEESIPLRVLPRDSVEEGRHFRILVKRQDRVPCICNPCNIPEQNGTHTLSPSEETQLPPSDHWVRTLGSQSICRLQGTSLLPTNFRINSEDSPYLSESRMDSSANLSNVMTDRPSPSAPNVTAGSFNTILSTESATSPISSIHSAPDFSLNSLNFSLRFSEQDMHVCEKSKSDLSNHDRVADNLSDSSLLSAGNLNSFLLTSCQLSDLTMQSARVRQVANRVVKHARHNKTLDESALRCPDCGLFPTLPVTGQCGHTRCTKCIQMHGPCPCGAREPKNLHVNTLIQDLIKKLRPEGVPTRLAAKTSSVRRKCQRVINYKLLSRLSPDDRDAQWPSRSGVTHTAVPRSTVTDIFPHTPMSPQARLERAQEFIVAGRHMDAVPHLARVAASSEPLARLSKTLLAKSIAVASRGRDPRRLTRALYHAVRLQAACTWLRRADLECVLCYHTYTAPVTTPCGHTYCRTCIERSMDYKKSCALCLRPLNDFNLAATRETVFICAALDSIDALNPPVPPEPDVIPIFVCTVAFPAIPCPLFIFDPRYWLMIRRVLESGSRKFGMVAYERDRSYSDYGTVLEVCDCVHLEDGRSILSTVGVSRFKVIERDVRDGCDVARIQPLADITPTDELVIWDLRIMAAQISYKALLWLKSMNKSVRLEIETAFGQLPRFDHREVDWWEGADGPAWLWWLIAILPLRSEIKVLILSTKNLLKRMMAVSRTLEAIDHVSLTTTTSECELQNALTNAEEWLERSA